ncbi:carbohydrate ABC transporter permease [Paenibacillus radicis (ex Gao et al. 2016)]|uniref:ABC transporter permease n=1 Tax=Paenibacillus radicis (ex Gao et al. 2016) TaxID=1737354 RepID=A0A917HRW9_9BACL|nr:sugar ABC transporter permease [Paenibacillus radicis (ex Gao et al. 2016)]GGG87131.1 ABC transporter permease [Paenibacillus radicis (ex Gao et al. 2016)]
MKEQGVKWLQLRMLGPAILFISLVSLYPFISGIIYSLKDGSLLNSGSFVGFANFAEIFRMSEFWKAFTFSIGFTICSVLGSYVVGLFLAVLLNMNIPGRGLFRVALLVPWVVSSVVSMVGWRSMIGDQTALVNTVIQAFGFEPILFLSSEKWAVFSVIMVKIWRSFPFMMVSLLATLQTINNDMYEAASIDGAGKWRTFVSITLQQLKTATFVSWILMSIWSFNDFDVLWLLTSGGPLDATQNLIIMSYKYAFIKSSTGIGSALGILSLIVLLALALILMRVQKKED